MELNKELDEGFKSEVWGVALDEGDTGAVVVGIINKDGKEDGTDEEGMLKTESPLPEEFVVRGELCGAVDGPTVPELENNPASFVDGCESSGKCNVGRTLFEATSFLDALHWSAT